ncbi:MAG TPA: MmcQ/YjbR family DNA-binding protein [Vicinamibacterales bacterium]|nr:MmcQ/YjbR family DNA-binding protein [Vicinamibacterales bacterium]
MTVDQFRALALSLPDTAESSHMDHPDFRVQGKIFATLGYPTRAWGVVGLKPEDQEYFCRAEPEVFVPVKGAWGRAGATQVRLKRARARSVRATLTAAWRHRRPKARKATRAKTRRK